MSIYTDEIFGPVAMLVRVKDLDEAIAISNASPYGNASSIYTTSGRAARTADWTAAFGRVPAAYIADGHHRAASAARVP